MWQNCDDCCQQDSNISGQGQGEDETKNVPQFRLPKVDDTTRFRAMKGIASVVGEGFSWGMFVVGVTFILVHLPEAFTGNYYYGNIFLIAAVVYFILYGLALLISWVSDLILHKTQIQPPPPPPLPKPRPCGRYERRRRVLSPSAHQKLEEQDQRFRYFFDMETDRQQDILRSIHELRTKVDSMFGDVNKFLAVTHHMNHVPRPPPSANHPTEVPRSPRSADDERTMPVFSGRACCPANQPCRRCVPESRNCPDCLRNPNCGCQNAAAAEERIRLFGNQQALQVARGVEHTKIHKRIAAMRPAPEA